MLAVAGIAGAGTMVVELAAVRLLAPWFGTSLVVWTNVIAVVLLALSLGYLLGGRLASRASPLRILSAVLLLAGSLVAWLPALGGLLASALLPEEIALHEAAGLVSWGSLCVSLAMFLPPATLIGMACPLVLESLARARHLSAGRAGGAVLFSSTLGSLAGVFGTSHVLLPALGVQRTFWLAGGVLFFAGLLAAGLAQRRLGRGGPLALAFLGAASALVSPPRPGLGEGRIELARRESAYQTLRVVEDRTQETPLRFLQVNEGFDSFQSAWQPEVGPLPAGFYYNDFLLPLCWDGAQGPWRVLVLGLGAGTVLRVFGGERELQTDIVGVELDPAVIELGREYFDLPADDAHLSVWSGLDARVALRGAPGPFEQIVLDCYSNQVEIPFHLCTLEFFAELEARLTQGGWLTVNLGGFDFEDPVVAQVAQTCANAFGAEVLLVRVPFSRNYLLLARREAPLPTSPTGLSAAERTTRLDLGPRRLPTFTRIVVPAAGAPVLSDDRCPIERLQERSIREARERRRGAGES